MKRTKFTELTSMSEVELRSLLKDARKEHMISHLSRSGGDSSSDRQVRINLTRGLKKKIARIMCALSVVKKK